MNGVLAFVASFVDWLVLTSFMASVIAALILVARYFLKNDLPMKWQYMLWFILLIRMVIPWAPESSISVFNIFSFIEQQSTTQALDAATHLDTLSDSNLIPHSTTAEASIQQTSEQQQFKTKITTFTDRMMKRDTTVMTLIYGGLFVIWLFGAVAFVVYLFVLNYKFAKKLKLATCAAANTESLAVLQQCKNELNMKRQISLHISSKIEEPTLYGIIQPKIILPAASTTKLLHSDLRYIFLHELVHLKRKDISVNWIMTILLVVHWFNPLLWYASRKMREDQELSCDAIVMSCIQPNEAIEYGYTIVRLLETQPSKSSRFVATATFITDKSFIKRRIKMISMFKRSSRSIKWSVFGLVIIAIFSTVALTNAIGGSKLILPESIPAFVKTSDIDMINWERKAVPVNVLSAIGNVGKSAVLGAESPSLNGQKWMWFLWGVSNIDLTIVGYHKDSKSVHSILGTSKSKSNIWTLENVSVPHLGADAHAPSSVKIPIAGEWAILLYTNGELFDILVYDIKE
ncbi:M56 family metallopeptidase [Paenibacillus sp. SC116]|uniref:M56 family metallopeptidase n=1 Tax=Paenibacillus sp. SC116 TaxID=2968986 RepID=UPI00215AA619|nr:M56 family metallopeptidase [Paenibacillus sp. SC116]MCR8842337.1 M56 family metallopeptidase [Paenibacillus sp. SC116]